MNKYKLYTVLIFLLLGLSSSPTYSENASEVSETDDTETYEAATDNEESENQEEFTVNDSDNSCSSEEQSLEEKEPAEEIDNAGSQEDDAEDNAEPPKKMHWLDGLLKFGILLACTR